MFPRLFISISNFLNCLALDDQKCRDINFFLWTNLLYSIVVFFSDLHSVASETIRQNLIKECLSWTLLNR